MLERRRRLAQVAQQVAEIAVRRGVGGVERDGLAIARPRAGGVSQILERVAEIVVGLGHAGREPERRAAGLGGIGEAAGLPQQIAQIDPRPDMAGGERDRPAVMRLGLAELALGQQHRGEVVMRLGEARRQAERLADQLAGDLEPAELVGQHAAQIERVDMVGLRRQDLAVDRLGGGQPAGAMMIERGLQRLCGRGRRRRSAHRGQRRSLTPSLTRRSAMIWASSSPMQS
jgi:hypothetical protein